jgi:hypothetical protein
MPALPNFSPKFSNTHNFWSVGPKIMKFVPSQSLFWGTYSQKVSKNLRIKGNQLALPKTGLSTVQTFGPLGDNSCKKIIILMHFLGKSNRNIIANSIFFSVNDILYIYIG